MYSIIDPIIIRYINFIIILILLSACKHGEQPTTDLSAFSKELKAQFESLRLTMESADMTVYQDSEVDNFVTSRYQLSKLISDITTSINACAKSSDMDKAVVTTRDALFEGWDTIDLRTYDKGEACYQDWERQVDNISRDWVTQAGQPNTQGNIGEELAMLSTKAIAAEYFVNQAFESCVSEYYN